MNEGCLNTGGATAFVDYRSISRINRQFGTLYAK
jgi:hypothetical protein